MMQRQVAPREWATWHFINQLKLDTCQRLIGPRVCPVHHRTATCLSTMLPRVCRTAQSSAACLSRQRAMSAADVILPRVTL